MLKFILIHLDLMSNETRELPIRYNRRLTTISIKVYSFKWFGRVLSTLFLAS